MRPSTRLVRAVAAERAELERHRARLAGEAADLRAALERIEAGLAEIDERRGLLDRLAPPGEEAPIDVVAGDEPVAPPGPRVLRGPAIRDAAVRVLVERGAEALHYREWFALMTEAGHAIAGKEPLAVFLTQLSRSPVLRKGARAGIYELDRHAAARLTAELDGLHHELRELTAQTDLAAIRARRAQLNADIGRTERALEEVARVLAPARTLKAAG